MQSHVNLKRSDGGEKSIANMTEDIVDSEMRFQVAIQNRLHPEISIAVVALERLLTSMRSYMPN